MATYDSESSGGEDNDYTETNVLLGYAAPEAQDDTISHLGGQPEWLDPSNPPSASLARCKICNDLMVLLLQLDANLPEFFPSHERRLYILTCRRKTCRRKEGSIRAIRGTRISEPANNKNNKQSKEKIEKEKIDASKAESKSTSAFTNMGESLFGAKPAGAGNINPFATSSQANPFSSSATSTNTSSNPFAAAGLPTSELAAKAPQNPFAPKSPQESTVETEPPTQTFASVLSLNATPPPSSSTTSTAQTPPHESWPTSPTSLPTPYPKLYLVDADYETLDSTPLPAPPQAISMDLDSADSTSGGSGQDKEIFESTLDTTFQKFADRLSQNPEQVIRYEFRGLPLLYSKTDGVGKLFDSHGEGNAGKVKVVSAGGNGNAGRIPRCGNCGAGRVFEVQVTPHAILELEREETGLDGMEWGTVILGVCEKDCVPRGVEIGNSGYVGEWAGVQWEDLGAKI